MQFYMHTLDTCSGPQSLHMFLQTIQNVMEATLNQLKPLVCRHIVLGHNDPLDICRPPDVIS